MSKKIETEEQKAIRRAKLAENLTAGEPLLFSLFTSGET